MNKNSFIFKSKCINSTYRYVGSALYIDIMFGREDKSDRLFLHELQNDQLISLINLTLQVVLNMKPKTDHRTFWTGLHDFLAVDIY